jgi:hypothetical protein
MKCRASFLGLATLALMGLHPLSAGAQAEPPPATPAPVTEEPAKETPPPATEPAVPPEKPAEVEDKPATPPPLVTPPAAPAPPPKPKPFDWRDLLFDRVLIQLNWGDDNLLIGAGETRENSPDPNFGRCSRTQIDGIVRKDCSAGTTRLGLYKRVDIGRGFSAAGALVLGLGVVTDPESSKAGQVSISDLGSYLRIGTQLWDPATTLTLDMFPVDARPMTLGFHPDLEWGTKDEFPRNFRRGAAPGLRLLLDVAGTSYAFVGVKTALIKSPLEVELGSEEGNRILFSTRSYYAVLGGFGLVGEDIGLSLELNGGFFHKGTLTKESVLGKDIVSGGGSLRVGYALGPPIGRRVDGGLYQRAAVGTQLVEAPSYASELAFAAAGEGGIRVQTLADFERPGSTNYELAGAAHLDLKFRYQDLRIHGEARMRTLTYITAEVPGFFPYSTMPSNSTTEPELQGLVSLDYRVLGQLTLGVTGGLRQPATYQGLPPQGAGEDAATAGIRTVVVSDSEAGGWYILPAGQKALPVFWVKLGLMWQPVGEFAFLVDVLYGVDQNKTQVQRDTLGHALRVYTQPNVVGINVLGQFVF